MKKANLFLILIAVMLLFSGCGQKQRIETKNSPLPSHSAEPEVSTAVITAVGDNLIHAPIYKQAKERTGGRGYDFKPAYINVKDVISAADLSIINQETPIGGEKYGISSYPQFNSPKELGEAVIDAGFDIVNHANNHAFDAGKEAVAETMKFWEEHSIPVIGLHYRDKDPVVYIEKNGIKFAFAAYSYGSNLYIDEDRNFKMSVIDEEVIKKELTEARRKADIVIVNMHWGLEYQMMYNDTQRELASLAASLNADLVIGHHPHVIQPVETIKRADGRDMPVAYSLGNFISSQLEAETMLGGMFHARVKKTGDSAEIEEVGFTPLVTQYEEKFAKERVIMWWDYTEELGKSHGCSELTYGYIEKLINKTIDKKYLDAGKKFVQQTEE